MRLGVGLTVRLDDFIDRQGQPSLLLFQESQGFLPIRVARGEFANNDSLGFDDLQGRETNVLGCLGNMVRALASPHGTTEPFESAVEDTQLPFGLRMLRWVERHRGSTSSRLTTRNQWPAHGERVEV